MTNMVLQGSKLLSIIDNPGDSKYSAEFSAMVPLADGCLMLVDASKDSIPGAASQQMKQLGKWNVEPVLSSTGLLRLSL